MFRNYLKLAFRNLRKNSLYATLNIGGLAVGLAGSVLVLIWASWEWSFNRFHDNLENIHVVMQNQTQGGVTYTFQAMPGPLAAGLRTDFPEIVHAARGSWQGKFLVSAGETSIHEEGLYAEPDFFKIFHFPVISGDPVAALGESGSVVITERTARKFFGNQDPVGKSIRLNSELDLKVAAVLADVPENSTLRFDIVLPFKIIEQLNLQEINSSWGNNSWQTWVTLNPKTNLTALNTKLENYIQTQNPEAAAHAFAYPLADLHLYGKFKEGKPDGGRIQILMLLGIIGLFVLVIACINFMNLTTARSSIRAREVGVRKAVGAQRSWLIGQFLTEAMLMTFIGLGISVLAVKLILPAFNQFTEKALSLDFSNWQIWSAILALGLLTGLLAGTYPAFFLSRFDPTRILRGKTISNQSSGGLLRKGLVTFQFFISIFLIITTFVIHRQLDHINMRPLGYDAENLISIPLRGGMGEKYDAFKHELQQIPGVKSVSTGSDNLVNFGSNTSGIEWPGKTAEQDFLISVTDAGYHYTQTADMQIVEGRDFSPEFGMDSMSCLLNETAVRMMGLKPPVVGTVLRYDTTRTVVGVVKDFVYNDGSASVTPLFIACAPKNGLSFSFVRFDNDGQWQKHLSQIEGASRKVFPDQPFEFRFVKEDYQRGFQGIRSTGQMANVFSGLAIFISCLGLFGLSAFFAEKRAKEIGIRKVLGASVSGLWFFFSKDFFKPVLLAFGLATAPAIWAMNQLLKSFDYRIELSWQIFALAGLAAIVVAAVTVSFHSIKAALANPVKSLRSE